MLLRGGLGGIREEKHVDPELSTWHPALLELVLFAETQHTLRLDVDELDVGLDCAAGGLDLVVCGDVDVDFCAKAVVFLGVIDAGFDGEEGAWEDAAFLVGFEVVEVSAVAVDFLAEAVACAVDEEFSVASVVNQFACGLIHLPAEEWLVVGETCAGKVKRGVAGGGDDLEEFHVEFRWSVTQVGHA